MQYIEGEIEKRGRDVYSDEEYNQKREELVGVMAQVNAICNTNGKGREDLTDIKILRAAEKLKDELAIGQAQSLQILADKIRQSVRCFRVLLRKYSENIDALDPQLKNNKELCEVIEVYENSWTLGRE